jgi:hypothetical protein
MPNDAAKKNAAPELYNLKDDPAETKNRAATEPERAKELAELLKTIRDNPASRK